VYKFVSILILIAPPLLYAHGGRLNSNGCHNQTSSETHHCHSGLLNGQSFSTQDAAQAALDALSINKPPSVFIVGGDKAIFENADGLVRETVPFAATAFDSDGTISSTEWLINTLVVATGLSANLSLPDGSTTVTFRAIDNDGASTTITQTVAIQTELSNRIPFVNILNEAGILPDADGLVGETVSFNAAASDPDGTIAVAIWEVNGQVIVLGTSANLALIDGHNDITFRATDNVGATTSKSVAIFVNAPAPIGQPIATIAGGDRTIPDSDNVTGELVNLSANIINPDSATFAFEWTVNGVNAGSGPALSITLADGLNTVAFEANDGNRGVSTATVSITVAAPLNGFPAYNRADYLTNWLDRDGDCIDTRDEVLMIESAIPPTLSSNGCDVIAGLWNDPYTGLSFTNPSDLDIDHLVPLKEAHDSGAGLWSIARKREFANDLATAHTLIAVDLSANRSKGSRDPAAWLPTNTAYRCEYVRNWVDVKNKYSLSIDEAERIAIESILGKTLSQSSRSESIGIRSISGDSTARFALSMRKNDECGYSAKAQTTDSLKINVSITPEEAQLDQTFDVFLVLSLNSQLLMLSPMGELLPFSGNAGDLVAFIDDIKLKESLEFTLFEGVLSPAIDINLFVAYMTSAGEFIFTPSPLSLKVQN
jgi:hypothetical protein